MCKIKVRREIPSRRNFAAEHGEKSIPVITHKNQLTGVSRCFAAKNMTVTFFLLWLFKYNFKLDVFISVQVVSIQSKLPIRSPLFSVTLQSAVSSGSPRTISNANAPLFSTHLSNAVNGLQKLSQIAKFSL